MTTIPGQTQRSCTSTTAEAPLDALRRLEESHPFWQNELFQACRAGALRREDFQFLFGQYHLYSRNFTRYLSGLMANLEDDLLRSRLSENLWEEGGGAEPSRRHAQIFRNFLVQGLGLDLEAVRFLPATRQFVDRFLRECIDGSALHASAFLSLGTEAIVARMYAILVEGLHKAGIGDEHLEFFHIHMACDDAHAATLQDILLSFRHQPGFEAEARSALVLALDLRDEFFRQMMDELRHRRIAPQLQRIQDKRSLLTPQVTDGQLWFRPAEPRGETLYQNKVEALNIDFTVERAPFPAEVIDARVVRIPPGRCNERHKHAHETVFQFLAGSGRVMVDDRWIEVRAGDCVFVPRWAVHQSQNLGSEPMVILALTDFHLTGKAFLGDYEATARMRRAAPSDRG
ncbi:MAG: hypothetical protein RIT25_2685 [Planctomycetota bacterium]